MVQSSLIDYIREAFRKKKNVKFGLLAEIRRGRGLRGIQEPNLLSDIFLLFKNDLIAPKHEKTIEIKMLYLKTG